ncbi:MAG: SUMF1/EgtB/PvdO family nonheme iron enzyme [Anaerolineales bacterium]|nr:SUMF1/EgtB/PvdO family nonheme iron enzyme [Anaerolineales bacterium]
MGTPERVLRGGAWNNNDNNVRSTNRNRNAPDNINNNIGFRCARSLLFGLSSQNMPRLRM